MTCGHQNHANSRFCTTCGSHIIPRLCMCGCACNGEDKFCGQCGRNLLTLSKKQRSLNTDAYATTKRYDLKSILKDVEKDQAHDSSSAIKVSQDDINALLGKLGKP